MQLQLAMFAEAQKKKQQFNRPHQNNRNFAQNHFRPPYVNEGNYNQQQNYPPEGFRPQQRYPPKRNNYNMHNSMPYTQNQFQRNEQNWYQPNHQQNIQMNPRQKHYRQQNQRKNVNFNRKPAYNQQPAMNFPLPQQLNTNNQFNPPRQTMQRRGKSNQFQQNYQQSSRSFNRHKPYHKDNYQNHRGNQYQQTNYYQRNQNTFSRGRGGRGRRFSRSPDKNAPRAYQYNNNQYNTGNNKKSRQQNRKIKSQNYEKNQFKQSRPITNQQKEDRANKFGTQHNQNKKKVQQLMQESSRTQQNKQIQKKQLSKSESEYSSQMEEEQQSGHYDDQQQLSEENQEEAEYSEDEDEYSAYESNYESAIQQDNQQIQQQSKALDQMCGKAEFQERLQVFAMNNPGVEKKSYEQLKKYKFVLDTSRSFTVFELNRQTFKPDIRLTLKRFRRSALREGDQNTSKQQGIRRSTKALVKVINHINENIIDSDRKKQSDLVFTLPHGQKTVQFIQIYDFLWDRMRQMVKDITRLPQNQSSSQSIIKICEQITRFFILAINQGRKNYTSQLKFDQKMNRESLTKIMTPLINLYVTSRMKLKRMINSLIKTGEQTSIDKVKRKMKEKKIYISPNQAQITAYAIIFSNDFSKYLYENILMGFDSADINPLFDSFEIKTALQVQKAMRNNNFEKYFEILQDPKTDFIMSALMLDKILIVRQKIFKNAMECYKFLNDQNAQVKGIQVKLLKKMLRFKSQQQDQFYRFLKYKGAQIYGNYVIRGENQDNQIIYENPHYIFDNSKLSREGIYSVNAPQYVAKVIRKDKQITRRQLIQRSWKKSSYIQDIIKAYFHIQNIDQGNYSAFIDEGREQQNSDEDGKKQSLEQQKSIKGKHKQIKGDKQTKDASKVQELRKKLMEKKQKEAAHKKMMTQFTDLLVDLFTPNQVRQQKQMKGLIKLINFQRKHQQYQYLTFFNEVQQKIDHQLKQQLLLLKLHQQLQNQKKFKTFYNQNYNEYSKKKFTIGSLSGITNLLNKNKNQKKKQKGQKSLLGRVINSLNNPNNQQGHQAYIKMVTDLTQNQLQANKKGIQIQKHKQHMIKIIKNLISTLSNGSYKQQIDLLKNIKICLTKMNVIIQIVSISSTADWTKLFGCNCLIYVTQGQSQHFENIMKQFYRIKQKIQSKVIIPLAVFRFTTTSDRINQHIGSKLETQCECLQFLLSSTVALSTRLKDKLEMFLRFCLKNRKNKYKAEVYPLTHYIDIINQNTQYLDQAIVNCLGQDIHQYFYYHQYFSMCLEQIQQKSNECFQNFQRFQNWYNILIGLQTRFIQIDFVKLESLMVQQKKDMNLLLKKLKIRDFQGSEDMFITNTTIFRVLSNYIQRFDLKELSNDKQLKQKIQKIIFKSNQMINGYNQVFKLILQWLSPNLQSFFILMPHNFKFSLSFDELEKRVKMKVNQIKEKQVYEQNNERVIYKISESRIQKPQLRMAESDIKQGQTKNGKFKTIVCDNYRGYIDKRQKLVKNFRKNQGFSYPHSEWLLQAKKKVKRT